MAEKSLFNLCLFCVFTTHHASLCRPYKGLCLLCCQQHSGVSHVKSTNSCCCQLHSGRPDPDFHYTDSPHALLAPPLLQTTRLLCLKWLRRGPECCHGNSTSANHNSESTLNFRWAAAPPRINQSQLLTLFSCWRVHQSPVCPHHDTNIAVWTAKSRRTSACLPLERHSIDTEVWKVTLLFGWPPLTAGPHSCQFCGECPVAARLLLLVGLTVRVKTLLVRRLWRRCLASLATCPNSGR